jgi:hypothetical protein
MSDLRRDHAPFRIRCEHDDGTRAHYAVNVEGPVALDARGPLACLAKMVRCRCKGAMLVLAADAEEPMVTNARKATT